MRTPKHVKEKGFFVCPGHKPCLGKLPDNAITEWLELSACCSLVSEYETDAYGNKYIRTRPRSYDTRTNAQWLADEVERMNKRNADPDVSFAIHYSEGGPGQFGCIIRRQRKKKKSEPNA